jgi:hypothetical protein
MTVGSGALLTRIPTIDDVLNEHATVLRNDFPVTGTTCIGS